MSCIFQEVPIEYVAWESNLFTLESFQTLSTIYNAELINTALKSVLRRAKEEREKHINKIAAGVSRRHFVIRCVSVPRTRFVCALSPSLVTHARAHTNTTLTHSRSHSYLHYCMRSACKFALAYPPPSSSFFPPPHPSLPHPSQLASVFVTLDEMPTIRYSSMSDRSKSRTEAMAFEVADLLKQYKRSNSTFARSLLGRPGRISRLHHQHCLCLWLASLQVKTR